MAGAVLPVLQAARARVEPISPPDYLGALSTWTRDWPGIRVVGCRQRAPGREYAGFGCVIHACSGQLFQGLPYHDSPAETGR